MRLIAKTSVEVLLYTLLVTALSGCGGARAPQPSAEPTAAVSAKRPIPQPITPPPGYRWAVQQGTRTAEGTPGPAYWQQWTDYRLSARLDPETRALDGRAEIRYHNRSPDTLPVLYLNLYQNLHAEGALRKVPQEVTGGVELARVAVGGEELHAAAVRGQEASAGAGEGARYRVEGTLLEVVLPEPLAPGEGVRLSLEWSFQVPREGIDGRMGWDSDNLFFLAYWYPQMAVYDDVAGWQTEPFRGRAEFYAGFGSYEVTVDVPAGWVVLSTGVLQNPGEVLAPAVHDRLRRAQGSDTIVHVVSADDLRAGITREGEDGRLRWRFRADSVRDVAFSATTRSLWDAARTPVGDRDGDGTIDYVRVDALYRESAPRWRRTAEYAQHALEFLSRYTGLSYPWPHMTAVEGGGIIGGGMEFPMMTLMGDYNERGDSALYYVTAHELAHMWVPMTVSTNERRYSWMDEGTTTFNENQARGEFFPGLYHDIFDQITYLQQAVLEREGEIMRWSDFHYGEDAFRVASYYKPASMLVALRALLGEETFLRAYRTYLSRWAFKHPYPWDMFRTFESVSGRELDWFWHSWYQETWRLDQAIASVSPTGEGTRIVVRDLGEVPMPVHLTITRADGQVLERRIPVETWLEGARSASVTVPDGTVVQRVEIDPAWAFPDINRRNNVWTR